jgi:ubiquinol-cytochrome c reductase cytochrome b subunit
MSATTAPTGTGSANVDPVSNYLDERTGLLKGTKGLIRKVFPDHWSFLLGEIALFSFILLLLSGTFLTLWFNPSQNEVEYHGSYLPLNGIQMSEAYASTLRLSFDVRGGLLMRQVHHWAALIFIMAIMVHMLRIFFTGAFRKPRELNWLIGFTLMVLGLLEGFAGYSPTTCCRARVCASPPASCWPSRSSARTSRTSCSAATSRDTTSSRACSPSTSCSCRV